MKRSSKLLPFILVALLAACSKKEEAPKTEAPAAQTPPAASAPAEPAPAPAPAPAASAPEASAPAASAPAASGAPAASASAGGGDLALGEKVFNANCVSCHGAGVLGAPKFGDKAAWGPRIAQGKDTLYTHALNGFKMMPPKGGNAALKDEEVKAAIDYMVSKAS
ncbi:cytochrome c5 family protein [Noviherbaspirillum sp. UKPF54]|uniref:c-type cytochrome n=1 Tax=Noviherbaspirillum sp. UKPF54 TaxID=2601898 RepID=UPI0011B13849|nr:c-type cytochrome [Noviherbaspirillum sp. UKPF54]QDZ28016.1 cytochrome c5 family protein [Noviherbaspirillum sp. UKPF54]